MFQTTKHGHSDIKTGIFIACFQAFQQLLDIKIMHMQHRYECKILTDNYLYLHTFSA